MKLMTKLLSLALSLVMIMGTFALITPVSAVAGDSADNPVIVTNFAELYDAMSSSSITYVKMYFNGKRSDMDANYTGAYGVVISTAKVLTIEGDNTIGAPVKGDVSALFCLCADLTVNGTGKLTYVTYAENDTAAIFTHKNDSLLTIDMTGTLVSIASDNDKVHDVTGKIVCSKIGRIYINNGNFISTFEGYYDPSVPYNSHGAIDVGGTVKMMIRGGTFDTYYCSLPEYDNFLPAVNIDSDHKAPGYIVIEGGTFNGIRSKAKTLDNYIDQNCVIIDENDNVAFDYKNQQQTKYGTFKDGKFDIINFNVSSVYRYQKPDFEGTWPSIPPGEDNFFEKLQGDTYEFALFSKQINDSLKENGFYIQDKMEIFDPKNNKVYSNVDSSGNGIVYEYTLDQLGSYTVKMYTSLMYGTSAVATTQQLFVMQVKCPHDDEIISDTITCTTVGTRVSKCKLCGREETITAGGEGHVAIEGYLNDSIEHHKVCDICSQIFESEEHTFDGDTCTVCGYVDGCEPEYMSHEYDNEYHWFYCMTHPEGECPNGGQLEKAPHIPTGEYNCQDGFECGECLWYYGETGKHLWVIDEIRCEEPTYESDGKLVYTCGYDGTKNSRGETIDCDELLEVKLPALHHVWDFENPVSTTATCEHEGTITYKCTEEGCTELYEVYVEKLDHDEEWVVITDATTEATGTKALTCKNCGAVSKYEDIPMLPSEDTSSGDTSSDNTSSEDTSSEDTSSGDTSSDGENSDEEEIMLGDINNNGKIDMTDYILLKRAYFGTYTFNEYQNKAGDINKNGKIDMTDYILLKRVYFGTYTIKK